MKHRDRVINAKVRRIGAVTRGDNMIAWAMLTLDVEGENVFSVAREDELASAA